MMLLDLVPTYFKLYKTINDTKPKSSNQSGVLQSTYHIMPS